MAFSYNWQASLSALVLTIAVVAIGRWLVFKIPAFKLTLEQNREINRTKFRKPRYQPRIKSSQKIGLASNLFFFIVLMPFCTTFEPRSLLSELSSVFLILMVYDFFYYLTHRFIFHGQGYFRRVHAVHHQARRPTSIDSYLLHPAESFVGIALYFAVIAAMALLLGHPFHVSTIVITMVIYTQLNQLNHVHIQLHRFPYNTINWIADKHAVHHIDMNRGNYATLSLLFDKLFGTYDSDAKTEAKA
jgi:sterol desaturase/sphingolipid hydroxylase (fatty acid hydroxylase superfamily)